MAGFTIDVHDQQVRAALQALVDRVGNPTPVLEAVADSIADRAKTRFKAGMAPDGVTPWKAKKHPDGRKTLHGETGDLRRQIVASAAGNVGTILANAPGGYSAIHQFGGTIERKAGQVTVRHRTNAKGELLRSAIIGGRGLVFAKSSHKRAVARTFDRKAYKIVIPARPYLPIKPDGSLYPAEQAAILAEIQAWLDGR
jgi:phage gpG-like protein